MSEEKTEKIVYKLYAVRTNDAVIDAVSDIRFTRITANYTLIYADDEQIMGKALPLIKYTIIEGEEASRLSAADKDWLMNCNFTIIAEEAIKNKELVLQNMADALDVLAEELEKSRTEDNGSEE